MIDEALRGFFTDISRTDAQGRATYNFRLPDNITSWRLTLSGISNDLYAGTNEQNIVVTNPMFLHYTLNDEFLMGDTPVIGVNVYGTGLTGGETVVFEVWDENTPGIVHSAKGAAFERVNIPLWEMANEGANALIIKATVSNGASDAVKHTYQVLKTYREIDVAAYYDVTIDTVFDVGAGGLTNITFTDQSRGVYLCELLGMRNVYGARIEKLLARREADKLIREYFPVLSLYNGKDSFDVKQYQRDDGGMAILPFADSDLETTVKLMPHIMEDVNPFSLKNYLYSIYDGENADDKMCALYGLAMLQEPVLLDMDNYSILTGLSVKDAVYIALGYSALGNRGGYTLRIPPQSLNAFSLTEVIGDVSAVSIYKKPMSEIGEIDQDVTVRRRYYKANESVSSEIFEQGDLVRVQVWIDYTAKALDGSYCVTDYLPSGFEYVSNSAKIGGMEGYSYGYGYGFEYGYRQYCAVEGQKVIFYDYNRRFDQGCLYYYYAGVINPGTFKAEGPLVQNLEAKDVYTVGEDSMLVIR